MAQESVTYDITPSVLVIGDSPGAADRAVRAVHAARLRPLGPILLEQAEERLNSQAALASVFIELDADGGPTLDALLRRLDAGAAVGRIGCVVAAPVALIDLVAAAGAHLVQLCDPSDVERAAALSLATATHPLRLHDVGGEAREVRLRELSDEVGRIAQVLARLSGRGTEARAGEATPPPAPVDDGGGEVTPAEVRALIRARRLRDQYFEPELFADPAWDMLLDLFAARLEYKLVAVSSLCIAAAVPPTTALRWIKTMSDTGLFVRRADPQDGRRVFIGLADRAAEAMRAYMLQLRRLGAGVV